MNLRRFRPIGYLLSDKGLAFPLQQTKTSANGSREDQIISIWELLKELESKSYQVDDQLTRLLVATESETRKLAANCCALTVTNVLLEAWRQGIKPRHLIWFWLETDTFETGISHSFFVVDDEGDRIFREEMKLVEGPEPSSHFDRSMFGPAYDSRFNFNMRRWYGRFYQETKIGKSLMLVPAWVRFWTGPKIFYYSGDWKSDIRAIRFLLVAILACLIFLIIRR